MKILRVIASLDPRQGGPSAGLRAITPVLEAAGHPTEFLCLDAPAAAAGHGAGAPVHALGPIRSGYGYSHRLVAWLKEHARAFDGIFVHGLWQYHGWAVRRALRGRQPYFVFPHGMLDPWFRRAYPLKHVKKWIYWQARERRVLRDAAAVLFTCEEERRLARLSFSPYRCEERVVAYGTSRPGGESAAQAETFLQRFPELRDRPYWLFLGRIHPKKGVDLLVEAYARLAAESAGSHPLPALVVAGPCGDQALERSLRAAAARVPEAGSVIWTGMLEGPAKAGALRAAEVFVLPSHQENFGIAVVEALAAGTPVLVSDKVNICVEIASDRAGLVGSDDVAGTLGLFRRWIGLGPEEREAMRRSAAASFDRRFEIHRVARSLIETVTPLIPSR